MPGFRFGNLYTTPGALEVMTRAGVTPLLLLIRHGNLEQGELDNDDHAQNKEAVTTGARIFSAFKVAGEKLWVITEAIGQDGERESTTILTPADY